MSDGLGSHRRNEGFRACRRDRLVLGHRARELDDPERREQAGCRARSASRAQNSSVVPPGRFRSLRRAKRSSRRRAVSFRISRPPRGACAAGGRNSSGWLRVAASVGYGRRILMPHVQSFLERHPAVRIDLRLSDGFTDLIEQGIDVAIRLGDLPDSSLVARKIGVSRTRACRPSRLFRAAARRRTEARTSPGSDGAQLHRLHRSRDSECLGVLRPIRRNRTCPGHGQSANQQFRGHSRRRFIGPRHLPRAGLAAAGRTRRRLGDAAPASLAQPADSYPCGLSLASAACGQRSRRSCPRL